MVYACGGLHDLERDGEVQQGRHCVANLLVLLLEAALQRALG